MEPSVRRSIPGSYRTTAETPSAREVLIVEDRPEMRDFFADVVRKSFNAARVYCRSTLEHARKQAARLHALDMVLLALSLEGCKGIEALLAFRNEFPRVPVIAVSARDDSESIVASLKAGAYGYLPRSSAVPVVVAALRLVGIGGMYVPPQVIAYLKAKARGSDLDDQALAKRLTERQRQVLRLMLDGYSNSEVARELRIAEGTVKQHAHAIYETIGISTRGQLFALAQRGRIRQDGSPIG